MNKKYYILAIVLLINHLNQKAFHNEDSFYYEVKRHFKDIFSQKDDLTTIEESSFPQLTEIPKSKIEINTDNKDLFFIKIETNEPIQAENISADKTNKHIRIKIHFDTIYYEILIKEYEFFVISESNVKIKNQDKTRFSSSSSRMSRKEKLAKGINLNLLKVVVNSKDNSIEISAPYEVAKNDTVAIEFR